MTKIVPLHEAKSLNLTSFIVSGATILTGEAVLTDAKIYVNQGIIKQLGGELPTNVQEIDASGYVVFPGLVNSHVHSAMGFFRDLGHGKAEMIETFLFPAERSLTPDLIAPLSYSYLYGLLLSGVTTVGDHYYFVEGVGKALEKLGLRGVIGETVADLGGAFPGRLGFDLWRNTIDCWPFSSRVTPAVAPHAADTVSFNLLKELADFAKARSLPLHLHLSQTTGELSRVLKREGLTPVAYVDQAGALTEKTLAVHLVSISDRDAEILKARGITAGICPVSEIIYEKLAPIDLLSKYDLPIALATDAACSNDTADLLAEARFMGLMAKHQGVSLSPQNLLKQITVNGATVLGLGHVVGKIAEGYCADLVFAKPGLESLPINDPTTNLIYSMGSNAVKHVMVDGRFVLFDRKLTLVSEDDLRQEYLTANQDIRRRIQY